MKTATIEQPELVEEHPRALAVQPADGMVTMIERLAANPDVNVDKLERLIAMQERVLAHNAKAAFDAAYSQMQPEIPEIGEHGQILVKGVLRSRYARLEDIQKVTKPILKEFGFAVRHRTEWPADKPGIIRIVGILTHREGHAEESIFEAKADASDYRTDIQSQGSTVSYGRRYTTIDLLNITTCGVDNDGQKKPAQEPKAPAGYQDWWTDIQAVADEGYGPFAVAWNNSKEEHRAHAMNVSRDVLAQLKQRAKAVDARAAQAAKS